MRHVEAAWLDASGHRWSVEGNEVMPTHDKHASGSEGKDMSVGRTRGGKVAISWECEPNQVGTYSFPQTQRVLMTEEEARWLFEELAIVLRQK